MTGKRQFWEEAGEIRLVSLARYTSRRALHWHSHPFYELGLVLSGECDWRLGPRSGPRSGPRARHVVAAGEAFLLPPGSWHGEAIGPDQAARVAWIGFDGGGTPPAWTRRPLPLGDDAAEIAQAFHAIYREHDRPENAARVRLALRSLLLLVSRQAQTEKAAAVPAPARRGAAARLNPRQARRIEAAAHTLRRNRLPIAQAAALHAFSPAHFSTLFRRHFRLTPRAFVHRARLERAEELLAASDLTIKEVAAEAGFADAAHFCKAFRKRHGTTPRAFREASKA